MWVSKSVNPSQTSTRAAQAAPPRMPPGTEHAAAAPHTPRCARISAATDQAIYRSHPARVEGSAAVPALKGNCCADPRRWAPQRCARRGMRPESS